ncbi:MAG: TetR/AcrR family transcriptional regulator [Porticoccaceae bacterium]
MPEVPVLRGKKPSSNRAKKTVEAILQAFESLCEQYGYDGVTTNLLAEKSGVSIGGIYQYFPNKQAIAIALYEETISAVATRLREIALKNINDALDVMISRNLGILLSFYKRHSYVLFVLPEANDELRKSIGHITEHHLIDRSSRLYLEQHLDEMGDVDLDRLRYVMALVVRGAMRDYLFSPHPEISDEGFVAAISLMLVRYIEGLQGVRGQSTPG